MRVGHALNGHKKVSGFIAAVSLVNLPLPQAQFKVEIFVSWGNFPSIGLCIPRIFYLDMRAALHPGYQVGLLSHPQD
jgi:hypothetical protein